MIGESMLRLSGVKFEAQPRRELRPAKAPPATGLLDALLALLCSLFSPSAHPARTHTHAFRNGYVR